MNSLLAVQWTGLSCYVHGKSTDKICHLLKIFAKNYMRSLWPKNWRTNISAQVTCSFPLQHWLSYIFNYYYIPFFGFWQHLLQRECPFFFYWLFLITKAELLQEGIFFLICFFARDVLVLKKMEFEKLSPPLLYISTYISFKSRILGGLNFFDFQLYY